jgi:hypothetical protein
MSGTRLGRYQIAASSSIFGQLSEMFRKLTVDMKNAEFNLFRQVEYLDFFLKYVIRPDGR